MDVVSKRYQIKNHMNEKQKNETRELNDDELMSSISKCVKQLDALPEVASLLVVFSGHEESEHALICSHSINNPDTVALALVNEAMIFGRQKEVLDFIRATRAIIDTAERNIEHYLSVQSSRN